MSRRIILVRHGEVALASRNICYGWSDVQLSERGLLQSQEIAEALADRPIETVWHSGLTRTRILAELIAAKTGASCIAAPALRERSFGDWEDRSWDQIYLETGAAMEGMMFAPDTFRPPGGETTFEMRDRMLDWYRSLPKGNLHVAVSHGGPIAALLGAISGAPPEAWPRLVPPMGTWLELAIGILPSA